MKNLIQAAVVTFFAASAVQAQHAVQWKVSDGGNGHWYGMRPIDYSRSWSDFIDTCAQIGATPAVLTSSSDADWISSHVVTNPPGDGALLGAELIPTSGGVLEWRWIDGRSFSSSVPWCGGAPGGPTELERWIYMNDQAHAHPTAPAGCLDDCPWGGWSSINVPWAVIEWSADCNNDGIVDYAQCRDGSLPDYNGNNVPDCCESGTPCVVGSHAVQWRVHEGGNGRWYEVTTYAVSPSWESARIDARARGGDLTSFQSSSEMDFCLRLAEHRPMAWRRLPATGAWWGPWVGALQEVGAAEPAGGWSWLDSPGLAFMNENRMTFNNQAACCGGNENRLFMYANGPAVRFEFLELNDVPETGSCEGGCPHGPLVFASVVEWSADCNNDGIVDKGQILLGQVPDVNLNGVPDGCECAAFPGLPACCLGDLNQDGAVDGADLGTLLNSWGACLGTCPADFDRNGFVDGADLGALLGRWGPCTN